MLLVMNWPHQVLAVSLSHRVPASNIKIILSSNNIKYLSFNTLILAPFYIVLVIASVLAPAQFFHQYESDMTATGHKANFNSVPICQ